MSRELVAQVRIGFAGGRLSQVAALGIGSPFRLAVGVEGLVVVAGVAKGVGAVVLLQRLGRPVALRIHADAMEGAVTGREPHWNPLVTKSVRSPRVPIRAGVVDAAGDLVPVCVLGRMQALPTAASMIVGVVAERLESLRRTRCNDSRVCARPQAQIDRVGGNASRKPHIIGGTRDLLEAVGVACHVVPGSRLSCLAARAVKAACVAAWPMEKEVALVVVEAILLTFLRSGDVDFQSALPPYTAVGASGRTGVDEGRRDTPSRHDKISWQCPRCHPGRA